MKKPIITSILPRKLFAYLGRHGFFHNMDDETYLRTLYRNKFKKELDLENPITFNEKLQWLKLYDRKPIYTTMVDKYEAKKYVANLIGEKYIIPTLGVWNSFVDIDFNLLPDKFVLKTTHDSGGIVICKDKHNFDQENARLKIENSLKKNFYYQCREWPYKNVIPRIIAEKYMENIGGLVDYKFYCFNGKPRFLYVSQGLDNHDTAKISFLTLDWEFAPFQRSDYLAFDTLPQKPENLNKMIKIAEKLSGDSTFLRVDLYEIEGNIYFSELTFSPCGGFMCFHPTEWDKKLGDELRLPI